MATVKHECRRARFRLACSEQAERARCQVCRCTVDTLRIAAALRLSPALRLAAVLGIIGVLAAAGVPGCAKIPADRYGVEHLRVHGAEQLDAESLKACLVTSDRERVDLRLGLRTAGACGKPPFDVDTPRAELWAWPWERWPVLDVVALEQDQKRIKRWYEARGFHDARIEWLRTSPANALEEDQIPAQGAAPCDRHRPDQGCTVAIDLEVDEGLPTLIRAVRIEGLAAVDETFAAELRRAVPALPGTRFDEATYDVGLKGLRAVLAEHGHARAQVRGVARVDRKRREAWIAYALEPGPVCVFGQVRVLGHERLPPQPIRAAAGILPGDRYALDDVVDAQRAVAGLEGVASAYVEPLIPDRGKTIDIDIHVTPQKRTVWSLGGGVQGGQLETETESISVPQWDVHLIGQLQRNSFLGGLRRLTLTEQPRMIFQRPFPRFTRPRFGNTLTLDFVQPGFLEPRTKLLGRAGHAYGPDPYDVFFRHRIDSEVAVERSFWRGKVFARIALHNSVYRVPADEERFDGSEPPANSVLTFPEQILRLDFRDKPVRPHQGALLQLSAQEAGYFLPSSWNYLRLLPDARVYVPLPAGITFAARFALGMLFITRTADGLDDLSQQLGPRAYRLRGGGASSNRGYLPGRLGDGLEGGLRRWEASVELRVPIFNQVGGAVFFDMGDVHRQRAFRFDVPQASSGFGLRYFSLFGSLRLDFAWQIPGWQVWRDNDPRVVDTNQQGEPRSRGGPFAFHFTIGEAF